MTSRILKPPPPFLFRYRPPDEVKLGYFEGLVRDNHIWASPPRSFIDLHDCRAQIDFEIGKEEMRRHWVRIFKKLGLKGEAAAKEARNVIANTAWKDPQKHAEIIENIQGTLDNSGVICLTDTALDNRMWEEYATSHGGICMCFEASDEPFSLVRDVNYVNDLPTVKINADSGEMVEAFLLTKGSSYSWEREWRFVDYNKGGGYKPIAPWALRAIVFGSQAEATVREEVTRLVSRWKPDVVLFSVERKGQGLRLQLVDGPQASAMTRIIPPIQERLRNEPARRPKATQLLDYLGSVSPENRRHDLDSRIELLASRLTRVESSQGRWSQDVGASALATVQEATDLLREIVDRSGAAILDYGEVAVFLYRLVLAVVVKPAPRS